MDFRTVLILYTLFRIKWTLIVWHGPKHIKNNLTLLENAKKLEKSSNEKIKYKVKRLDITL